MSPSALPLYNTDKLIYKSGFFNKFKETLPIVSWFFRKEEKGHEHLLGSGKLDKHGRVQLRVGHRGLILVPQSLAFSEFLKCTFLPWSLCMGKSHCQEHPVLSSNFFQLVNA